MNRSMSDADFGLVIDTQNLTKSYAGGITALRKLDLKAHHAPCLPNFWRRGQPTTLSAARAVLSNVLVVIVRLPPLGQCSGSTETGSSGRTRA